MLADRRAKIVATIGPATQSRENLRKCIEAGMNVARLNFSHGTHQDHSQVIQSIRELTAELEAPVAILQDLQGPKIRVGRFSNDSIELIDGQEIVIKSDKTESDGDFIPTDFKQLAESCKPGTRILLDDGLLELNVTKVSGTDVYCQVVFGGILKSRKGMNLPGAMLPVECMTPKDLDDLEFGLSQKVDYVALSFVRRASDIRKLRELVDMKSPSTRIVAKIEMLEAIDNLKEIVHNSDAVMVARGDLAVEVGQTRLPHLQKEIISLCNELGKPVITATQMLDSMVENPRPTRAEITDVANAVLDGSDACMLSAETASGKYPFKCITTMGEIICEVERDSDFYYAINVDKEFLTIADAIAEGACLTALKLNATAIVCLTTSGKTASMIAAYRPKAKVIAVTHLQETLNRLELVWGIQTLNIKPYKSTDEAMSQIQTLLLRYGLIHQGDKVVLTLGVPVLEQAKTNSLRVYTITKSASEQEQNLTRPLRLR